MWVGIGLGGMYLKCILSVASCYKGKFSHSEDNVQLLVYYAGYGHIHVGKDPNTLVPPVPRSHGVLHLATVYMALFTMLT